MFGEHFISTCSDYDPLASGLMNNIEVKNSWALLFDIVAKMIVR